MREVEDEGLLGIALVFKKVDRLISIETGKTSHILGGASGLIILVELDRTVVIGTQCTEVIIKTLGIGHAFDDRLAIRDIPLGDTGSLLTNLPDKFSKGDFSGRHAPALAAERITPGQEGRA